MPILKPSRSSEPVFYPKTDYTIVKYIDLTKFISLLYNQSLFFCRLDKLEDQFEGTTAKANFDFRVKWNQQLRETGFFKVPMTDETIIKNVTEEFKSEKKFKAINCVNCWNKKDDESAALWKIYSDFSKGIMIKSSISRLEKSLENREEEILLSEIHYLNYNKQIMPDGYIVFPFIHKQIAYSYEDEVRLIYGIKTENNEEHDWTKEEVLEGIYIKCDLNELIEEIIIGPYSPQWFFKLIQDILNKYGLKKVINKSDLSY
jgi:hypothetical protein